MPRPTHHFPFDNMFDFSFRPETYWPETPTEQTVLASIPGTARRQLAAHALEQPTDPRIPPAEFLLAETLSDEER